MKTKNSDKQNVVKVFEVQYGHDQIIDQVMAEYDKMSEAEKEDWYQKLKNYKKQ